MTSAWVPQIVGVIFARDEFERAIRMQNPPDLFELRLDALFESAEEIEAAIGRLGAPLIITARHPSEGGSNQLSAQVRATLLRRFLPHAAHIDIELRSSGTLAPMLAEARAQGIRTIASFHDFDETPSDQQLDKMARTTQSLGADMLKIATRTDTPAQLQRLMDFFLRTRSEMEIAAMGVGRLGRVSRIEFARHGSALNYGHLGKPQAEGQLSIAQLRRLFQVPGAPARPPLRRLKRL